MDDLDPLIGKNNEPEISDSSENPSTRPTTLLNPISMRLTLSGTRSTGIDMWTYYNGETYSISISLGETKSNSRSLPQFGLNITESPRL